MKKQILCIFCLAIISVGCYKDEDNTPPPQVIIETSEVIINTSISGNVLDLEGNLLSDYMLMIDDQPNTIPSDYFLLGLDEVKKKGQTIHVFKDDKQIGIRTELLIENDINHLEIQQHPEFNKTVLSDNNPEIDFTKSLKADFSSTQWEGDYKGEITIDYVSIESNISLTPVGYNTVSELLAVDSRGGFYLSATDENGETIIAKEETPILLQTGDLDEDINSLFVFDIENEAWILVTEFSSGDEVQIRGEGYYTFANYASGVFVEGRITKEDRPVAYQAMDWTLTSLSNQFCATEKGKWIGLLPKDQSVNINLLNFCDESLQSETIEISASDIKNQDLEIKNSDNYQLLNIQVIGCDEEFVAAPNLSVSSSGNKTLFVFSEEYNDRWIAVCDEFSIAAVDENTGESGPELSWSTQIMDDLNVLTHCNELKSGYSFIKIRDEVKMYSAFSLKFENQRTILQSEEENVKFYFRGMEEGMYAVDQVNVFIDDMEFGMKGYYIKCENSTFGCGFDNFNVTHYDTGENGMVRVSFSGTLWMQTLSPSVAGNFDVEGVILIKI